MWVGFWVLGFLGLVCHAQAQDVTVVAGVSGAGKKTLIRRLLDPSEAALRSRFGVGDSVSAYGCSFKGPLRSDTEHLLIQWQFAEHELIGKLREQLPEARIRIVILWRPFEDICAGLLKRPNQAVWGRSNPKESARQWGCVLDKFRPLQKAGYEVEVVDASQPDFPSVPF